uniref:Myb-like domain-containing protein n=1 Tax=Kalanchoe fedtschenkoi TaxID=63787 RepID=A0A7N1A130_KALFE
MEQVDEQQQQAAAEVDVVNHHQNNSINNHYAGLIQTSKPLTTSMSYFQPPQPTNLDHPIYSALSHRFFFNSNTHNNQNQQQQRPYHEVDGIGTTSTYLAASGGLLLESCSAASEATAAAFNYGSGNSCSSRWPREETMSLLQIRSRLHSNFKQATHKGPLWDEVSRIMYEEHGYQRSGKKCREKFENLYKYYKKTKEAKSGKHDGKNYRFFRQLEALYGDQNEVIGTSMTDHLAAAQPNTISSQAHFPPNPAADSDGINNNQIMMMGGSAHLFGDSDPQVISPNNHHHNSMKLPCDQSCLSLSNHNSSLFTSSSSEDNKRGHNKKYKLKVKIKEFIDTQMNSLMEQQQFCMEKVMETIEKKETERALREEEWRQEAEERLEKEHKYWESERAWMKARDAALMETIQKLTAARSAASSSSSVRDVARVTSLASHMQQIPFSSSSGNLINKQPAEIVTVRNPQALYNYQESQDGWFMAAANHHHHHDSNNNNGFRFVMSDGNNGGSGGSVIWDGSSSFGLKLNNGDDDHHHRHQN